jgi:hypothetical protein
MRRDHRDAEIAEKIFERRGVLRRVWLAAMMTCRDDALCADFGRGWNFSLRTLRFGALCA